MPAEDVGGIALEFNVDTSGFSAGISRMREELNGLKAQAARIEIGIATGGVAATGRTVRGGGGISTPIGTSGGPGGTSTAPLVSPRFQVSAGSVRQLRTDINAQMRAAQAQGEAVAITVKLGRVPYAAMRNQISIGIGDVPIRGLSISPAVIASALRQVSAAVVAQSSSAAGIPKRAAGGAVSGPVIVGERRPELFIPTSAGRMMPYVPHAERGARTSHARLSPEQADFLGNLRAAAARVSPQQRQGGLDWYTSAGNYGRSRAAHYGVDPTRAIGALAALSAGTSWEANKTKFERILTAQAGGKPFPYSMKLDAHRKAAAILSGSVTPKQAFSSSPKVGQFFGGLMGDLSTLTIDRWAARTASRGGLDQPGRGKGRARMAEAWKQAAQEAGMAPAQFQAALWLLQKEESSGAPGQMRMGLARGGPVGPGDPGFYADPTHGRGPAAGYHLRANRFTTHGGMRFGPAAAAKKLLRRAAMSETNEVVFHGGNVDLDAAMRRMDRPPEEMGAGRRYWARRELGETEGISRERIRGTYDYEHQGDAYDIFGPKVRKANPLHMYRAGVDMSKISKNARGGYARGGFCSVCRSNISNPVTHRSTAKHLANLRGPSRGSGDWMKRRSMSGISLSSSAQDAYEDELGEQRWQEGDPWFYGLSEHRARGGAMRGAGFVPGLRSVAQSYNRSAGLPRMQEHMLHPVDPGFGRRTALAYEGLRGGSSALDRRAYRAFAEETGAQYEHLRRAGFSFSGSLDDPYSAPGRMTKMQQAAADVRKNRHLTAFGSALEHPLLSNAENLQFRQVHDMMGHLTEGYSIGPRGEFNAAVKHSQMYSPLARRAMLAETHGQNSVVNFSPTIHPAFGRSIADVNREHPGSIYADQKARGLPDDIMEEFYARTGIHRQLGGITRIKSLAHLRKFAAQNEGLYSRWTPSIKRDMQPGATSAGMMDRRLREAGISAHPLPMYRGTPWQSLISGEYDTGPAYGDFSYRKGRGRKGYEGFRRRNLWLMGGTPVGRGFDDEPVLDPTSIQPRAIVSRRAVEEWHRERFPDEHRARGGKARLARDFALPGLGSTMEAGGTGFENVFNSPGRKGSWDSIIRKHKLVSSYQADKMYGWAPEELGKLSPEELESAFASMSLKGMGRRKWHMAQGGPAKKGGLPRGYRVEFMLPGEGELLTKDRAKGLFGKPGEPGTVGDYAGTRDVLIAQVRHLKSQRVVASSPFGYDKIHGALHPEMTAVDPPHQRKGLATAMYVKAERFTGRPVMPSETQSPYGRGLWSQGDRPFGKRFGERPIGPITQAFLDKEEQARQEQLAHGRRGAEGRGSPTLDRMIRSIRGAMATDAEASPLALATDFDAASQGQDKALRLSRHGEMRDAGPLTRRLAQFKRRASGGGAGQGLYIVNELGRETFVPKSHEHLIPQEVGEQIPGFKRTPGSRRGGPGPSEINGVGPRLWQAPGDGWIIPNRLKNKIPHAAAGDTIDSSSGSGFGPAFEAQVAARTAQARARRPDYTADFEKRFAERLRTRETVKRSRNLRAEIYQNLPQGQGPEVTDMGLINARISQSANRGLTGRAALGGAAAFFLGGGEQRRRALAEAQATGREYTRLAPEKGVDTLEGLNTQIIRLEDTSRDLHKQLSLVDKSTVDGAANFKKLHTELRNNEAAISGVTERTHIAGQLRQREQAALAKAQGGAAQNFAAVTAAGFAFNIGMTAVNEAFTLAAKTAAPLVDQLTGFGATSQRVTKELAEALPEAGTVSTLFARRGAPAGLSLGTTQQLQGILGPSVTAKAGANAAGQASDLFRAALGGGAPSGLIGGFGGVLGSSFLGTELGGGKGFAETVAGDVSVSRRKTGLGELGDTVFGARDAEKIGAGLGAAGRELRNEVRGNVPFGLGQQLFGPNEEVFKSIETVDQETLKVQKAILTNFNEASQRGARASGFGNAAAQLTDVGIGSADAQKVLGTAGVDAETAKMARAGVVFKDVAGNVITSVNDLNKAYAQASLGFTIPDQATFAAGQAQQLRAGEQASAARGEFQRGVEIPGQLGQQLTAQPFQRALTGITDASKVTITDLTKTQQLQDDLTKQALDGIERQAQAIDQNVGAGAGQQFRSYMTQVGDYGKEIQSINEALTSRQAALGRMQFVQQMHLIDRSIGDVRGFLGRSGGSGLGRIERRQFDIGRESQQLGFASAKLQRAADALSLAMNQRQINFGIAVAGFQAPGITGEERAARIEEAKAEAAYQQKQQDIAGQQFGIGGQQLGLAQQAFALEGQAAMENAKRQLEDLERQKAISEESYAIEQEQIAAEKRIAVLTLAQSQLQAKALSIFNEATTNFDARLAAAAQYVAVFSGTVAGGLKIVSQAIDQLKTPGDKDPDLRNYPHAAGGAFITNGPTQATFGEAGTEMGVFLRNPRPLGPGAFGGGGGSTTNITIDVHDNAFKGEADEDRLVRKLTSSVKEVLSREAKLLGVA